MPFTIVETNAVHDPEVAGGFTDAIIEEDFASRDAAVDRAKELIEADEYGELMVEGDDGTQLVSVYALPDGVHADPVDDATTLPTAITAPTLNTEADVREWFDALHAAGVGFHPEDDPSEIINIETGQPIFTKAEATTIEAAMRRAYELCDDPCELALASLNKTNRED